MTDDTKHEHDHDDHRHHDQQHDDQRTIDRHQTISTMTSTTSSVGEA